jgi:vesicle coat complex subunit
MWYRKGWLSSRSIQDRVSARDQANCLRSVIIPQDIFRKYPHSYEGIIPVLCANLDDLDEPEAKASLIWIIGEYAEKIDNADELLGIFLESFKEEPHAVSSLPKPIYHLLNYVLTPINGFRCNCKQ